MTAVRKTYALWQKLGIKAYNIQEVHDSIVVEVHYKDAYHVMTAGKDVIESVTCPSAKGKIKFEVDAVVGCHLGAKQKVNSEIIEMAKDDSLGLYKLLRKDLNYPPEYYIG
jgi:hypothetical protein